MGAWFIGSRRIDSLGLNESLSALKAHLGEALVLLTRRHNADLSNLAIVAPHHTRNYPAISSSRPPRVGMPPHASWHLNFECVVQVLHQVVNRNLPLSFAVQDTQRQGDSDGGRDQRANRSV